MCAQKTNPVGLLEASKSPLIHRELRRARAFSLNNEIVSIHGETGTGKEAFAHAIHSLSPRRDGPFVVVNCGAIPSALIEAELFGHTKGAFSGAFSARKGKFAEAHGGTLFLDEIGELPLEQQVKLLRVLETKKVTPLGSNKEETVDIRVVVATNRDLRKMVEEDRTFRDDLYYRLNVFPLKLPALRERPEDIPALAKHFLSNFLKENEVFAPMELSSSALQVMQGHEWKGNVRALRGEVLRSATEAYIANRTVVMPQDLSFHDPSLEMVEPIERKKGAPSIRTIAIDENELELDMFSVRAIFDAASRVMKPAHLGIFSDIHLRHAEKKLTLNQAAAKYNLSNNGTLKAHLSDARKELRGYLSEEFPGLEKHPVIRDYLYQTEEELGEGYPFYSPEVIDLAKRHDPEQSAWSHILLNRREHAIVTWCLSIPKGRGALKLAYEETQSMQALYKFSGLKTIAFKFSEHAKLAGQLEASFVTPAYEKDMPRQLRVA